MITDENDKLSSRLSLLIISSPAKSHPSLFLLESVFQSIIKCLPEINLFKIPIIVILDGYHIIDKEESIRPKKGKITNAYAEAYQQYYDKLNIYLNEKNANYKIISLQTHHGFALGVKHGLHVVTTDYCLICQHDRIFKSKYTSLQAILNQMDTLAHIRYVGFPASTNNSHNTVIHTRYQLDCLNDQDMIISLNDSFSYLQPLIFWFDSNHLCHVKRYLQIFQPYKNLPNDLKQLFGIHAIGGMCLRVGDFIEDRFGQAQRHALAKLSLYRRNDINEDVIKSAFRWFGSYLIWIPDKPYETHDDTEYQHDKFPLEKLLCYRAKVMVKHMSGRTLSIEKEDHYENYRINRSLNMLLQCVDDDDSDSDLDDDDYFHINEEFLSSTEPATESIDSIEFRQSSNAIIEDLSLKIMNLDRNTEQFLVSK